MLFCRYAPTFRTWLLSEAPIKRRNQEGMNMCKNKCEDRSELGILFLFFSFLFVSNCFYMACSVLQAPCRPCLMKSTGAGVHDTFLPAGRIRQQDAARGLLSQPPISSFFDGNRKRVTTYAFFLQPQWLNTQFLMGRSGRYSEVSVDKIRIPHLPTPVSRDFVKEGFPPKSTPLAGRRW